MNTLSLKNWRYTVLGIRYGESQPGFAMATRSAVSPRYTPGRGKITLLVRGNVCRVTNLNLTAHRKGLQRF